MPENPQIVSVSSVAYVFTKFPTLHIDMAMQVC